jgi:starch synthase (maltosyl-transferring)
MIDLVVNHCAIDSGLTREHPEWFVREPDGRIRHPSCDQNGQTVVWRDLAQFDHRHTRDPEGLYQFCLRLVGHLAALGFEGFRCDAAYQIPAPFWGRLLWDARARHRHLTFVAETLGCTPDQTCETARAGFDYVFNSAKWWNYHDGWMLEGHNRVRDTAPSISFPESHDTPRLAEECQGNINSLKQRYLFSAVFSAGVMIPAGFEFGQRRALHVVHTTPSDWTEDGPDLRPFIKQVNTLKRRHRLFQEEGPIDVVPYHNPNILLMRKSSQRHGDQALLILNKDPWSHQEFYAEHLRHLLPAGVPLRDVSPEYPLERVHEPFHYGLRPGQGIVLLAERN